MSPFWHFLPDGDYTCFDEDKAGQTCGWDGTEDEAYCTRNTINENICARARGGGRCEEGQVPPFVPRNKVEAGLKDALYKRAEEQMKMRLGKQSIKKEEAHHHVHKHVVHRATRKAFGHQQGQKRKLVDAAVHHDELDALAEMMSMIEGSDKKHKSTNPLPKAAVSIAAPSTITATAAAKACDFSTDSKNFSAGILGMNERFDPDEKHNAERENRGVHLSSDLRALLLLDDPLSGPGYDIYRQIHIQYIHEHTTSKNHIMRKSSSN